ncbi:3-dehydroquinate synthase [Legionella beliardensis]|uniref:3-dehydroquinate synthase n=1 Tax=Legionella beliardensis TaxID=91822 RepID=A0A378I0Y8_9GAMM|nr:3-dehydroquinate synthase [Legionella beliardensis]STX28256.1 3-dehydroquinate synthase [Legionella beliardensis]
MASSELLYQLKVNLLQHDYPILIGTNFLKDNELLPAYVKSKQVMIITNQTIAPLYLEGLQRLFADKQCDCVILADGEEYKNQQSLFQIFDTLIEKKHHRDTTIIALGGGVIGDIAGFAASAYQRGVDFIQVPTTLLAQVDASVGGKTAINHPQGKNMIGSFYQPNAVVIDVAVLNTLPIREFRAGFAEVIKYAILEGGDFFSNVRHALKKGLSRNSPELAEIIYQCCQIKANYVQKDERESGLRALLNLGHTIGHALEAYTQYKRWLHGEAVGIGLYCAALLSHQLGELSLQAVEEIDELLTLANLPRRIPKDINLEHLQMLLATDKKIKNNTLRFIVIKGIGNCSLATNINGLMIQQVMVSAVEGE